MQFLSHQKILQNMHMRWKSGPEFSDDLKKVVTPPFLQVPLIGESCIGGLRVIEFHLIGFTFILHCVAQAFPFVFILLHCLLTLPVSLRALRKDGLEER